jgi:hypothetical protein
MIITLNRNNDTTHQDTKPQMLEPEPNFAFLNEIIALLMTFEIVTFKNV